MNKTLKVRDLKTLKKTSIFDTYAGLEKLDIELSLNFRDKYNYWFLKDFLEYIQDKKIMRV